MQTLVRSHFFPTHNGLQTRLLNLVQRVRTKQITLEQGTTKLHETMTQFHGPEASAQVWFDEIPGASAQQYLVNANLARELKSISTLGDEIVITNFGAVLINGALIQEREHRVALVTIDLASKDVHCGSRGINKFNKCPTLSLEANEDSKNLDPALDRGSHTQIEFMSMPGFSIFACESERSTVRVSLSKL